MRLNGLGVSPGIGIGRALVVTRGTATCASASPSAASPRELERLDAARAQSRVQIEHIKQRIAAAAGAEHAYLFDAQLLLLDDPMLVDRAAAIVRDERLNAESALQRALDEVSALFDKMDDPYLRERKGDVADVVGRLCMNLRAGGDPLDLFRDVEGPLVLVADELSPSLIAQLDVQRLAAFVTDAGSWTYHTAILARSMHVPAVAGLRHASGADPAGRARRRRRIDRRRAGRSAARRPRGSRGALEQAARLRAIARRARRRCRRSRRTARRSASRRTSSCRKKPRARASAAPKGIGLYRSEFLLAGTGAASLDEEAQYAVYRRLLEAMAGGRVTVRTFDVTEAQMGLTPRRGDRRDRRSACAACASACRSTRCSRRSCARCCARRRTARCGSCSRSSPASRSCARRGPRSRRRATTLRARGLSAPDVPIGIMIEVPSAALTIDLLAGEADFVSIGTNDLIQYTLAVDRTDDRVSAHVRAAAPGDPARAAPRGARRAAARRCRSRSAARWRPIPPLLPLLAGLGLREFSMTPAAIPVAKQVVRGLRISDTARLASRALKAATPPTSKGAGGVAAAVKSS